MIFKKKKKRVLEEDAINGKKVVQSPCTTSSSNDLHVLNELVLLTNLVGGYHYFTDGKQAHQDQLDYLKWLVVSGGI